MAWSIKEAVAYQYWHELHAIGGDSLVLPLHGAWMVPARVDSCRQGLALTLTGGPGGTGQCSAHIQQLSCGCDTTVELWLWNGHILQSPAAGLCMSFLLVVPSWRECDCEWQHHQLITTPPLHDGRLLCAAKVGRLRCIRAAIGDVHLVWYGITFSHMLCFVACRA